MIFTFTSGPVPVHSNLYSPGASDLPSTVTLVSKWSDFLFPLPAKALADNNNELPTNSVKSFVAFICNSLFLSPGAGALETTFRPAEDCGLVIRLIRRYAARRRYAAEAAKFACGAENNFMVESGGPSILDSP